MALELTAEEAAIAALARIIQRIAQKRPQRINATDVSIAAGYLRSIGWEF